jgi:hypothetical protein
VIIVRRFERVADEQPHWIVLGNATHLAHSRPLEASF